MRGKISEYFYFIIVPPLLPHVNFMKYLQYRLPVSGVIYQSTGANFGSANKKK